MTDVRFVLVRHEKDNVLDPLFEMEMEWSEFCEWLVDEGHEIRGIAGSPSAFERDFKGGCRGANRHAGMILGNVRWGDPALNDDLDYDFVEKRGTSGDMRRADRNFDGACAAVAIDVDDLSPEEHTVLRARLAKYDAVEYSTYSHGKDPTKVKLRILVRLDREQSVTEVGRVRRGACTLLDCRIDKSTINISRIFYRPAAHPDRAEHAFMVVHTGGLALSVDACLAEAPVTERDLLARHEIVWDGITPASHMHRNLAEAELEDWLNRCGRMTGEDAKRTWLLQRTMRFGSYIRSGCMPGAETRKRMHDRIRELMAWAWSGDDHSPEYRIDQVNEGLSDGFNRCGLLPGDREDQLRQLVIESATDAGVAPDVIDLLTRVSGTARRDLLSNAPDTLESLEDARRKSFDFGMTISRGELLVDSSSAGTGKSYNMAKIASAKARLGLTVVIQTRENTVGAQTREQIDPDVKSVQLYSPLSPPAQAPVSHKCVRAPELEWLRGSGTPIRAVCTRCPLKDQCPALDAHSERLEALDDAQVVFVSQAGIGQASELLDNGALLMTDEQPDTGEWDAISDETLRSFTGTRSIPWVPVTGAREVIAEVAKACLGEGKMPVRPDNDKSEWLIEASAWKNIAQTERDTLLIAKKLWEVYIGTRQQSRLNGQTRLWKLDRAYLAMVNNGGLLCDATPFKPALPRPDVMKVTELRQHVRDSAPVKRAFVSCPGRTGSSGLFPNGAVDTQRVEEMFRRLKHFAERDGAKTILLVTFKAIEAWVEENRAALELPEGLELAHFGAVRGKNRWKDFDLIYVFGTPRFDRRAVLEHFVKDTVRIRDEWERCAAAELEQAIARLRPVSRDTPCTMVCESEVVPWSWYASMDGFEIILLPETEIREKARRTLLGWVAGGTSQLDIAEALNVDPSQVSRWKTSGVPKEKVYVILSAAMQERMSPNQPDCDEPPDPPEEEPEIPVDFSTPTDVDSPPDLPEE